MAIEIGTVLPVGTYYLLNSVIISIFTLKVMSNRKLNEK